MKSIDQIGIDVSKRELVVSTNGQRPKTFSNSVTGVNELIQQLNPASVVHLESTGGYERLANRMLKESGFQVHRHNPLKTKRLAQATSTRVKTDPVDAKHLAINGNLLPACQTKSVEREKLSDLSRLIEELKSQVADHKKRIQIPEIDEESKMYSEIFISQTTKLIKKMEMSLAKRIRKSPLVTAYKNALTVPSIGRVSAQTILCELPEDANERTPGEIASYCGLAPMDNSSGQSQGKKRTGGGNKRIKACLYMCAISALKHQDWAKHLYSKLKAKGRSHRGAIVAVMRRLLIRVIAVIKRGSPWQAEPTP